MLYQVPDLEVGELPGLIDQFDRLRGSLSHGLDRPRPWTLPLLRQEQAAAWSSSIAIEGFSVSVERALELTADGSTPPVGAEEKAFHCYADAMEHVAVLAVDPLFEWSPRVILDLHFEACRFRSDTRPGLVRTTEIGVTDGRGGLAYVGPGPDRISHLLRALADDLQRLEGAIHPSVAGALAHLDLVSIHPFEDGNGRISRIVQSLVLARDGLLAPEFGSIEPSLADDTAGYYRALQTVQGGGFNPDRDPTSWIEYCLRAHLRQARRRLEMLERAAARWQRLERLVEERSWDDRLVIALELAFHGSVDRAGYATEADIALPTASNDLRRLLDAGLIERRGKGRATAYSASPALKRAATE